MGNEHTTSDTVKYSEQKSDGNRRETTYDFSKMSAEESELILKQFGLV